MKQHLIRHPIPLQHPDRIMLQRPISLRNRPTRRSPPDRKRQPMFRRPEAPDMHDPSAYRNLSKLTAPPVFRKPSSHPDRKHAKRLPCLHAISLSSRPVVPPAPVHAPEPASTQEPVSAPVPGNDQRSVGQYRTGEPPETVGQTRSSCENHASRYGRQRKRFFGKYQYV